MFFIKFSLDLLLYYHVKVIISLQLLIVNCAKGLVLLSIKYIRAFNKDIFKLIKKYKLPIDLVRTPGCIIMSQINYFKEEFT